MRLSGQTDKMSFLLNAQRNLLRFLHRDERGYTGAQKALLALLACGLLLMVTRIIFHGSDTAAERAKQNLVGQSDATVLAWADSQVGAGNPSAPSAPADSTASGERDAGESGGFWRDVGDFFRGVGGGIWRSVGDIGNGLSEAGHQIYGFGKGGITGLWEMGQGIANLAVSGYYLSPLGELLDPAGHRSEVEKWGNIIRAVRENPGAVWDAITQPYVDAWERGDYGEALGRGTVEVVVSALGAKGLDKLGKATVITKVDDVANALNRVDDVTNGLNKLDDLASGLNKADEVATSLRKAEKLVGQIEPSLVKELEVGGAKFSPEKMVGITKTPEGKVVWLEEGGPKSGLEHILHGNPEKGTPGHLQDFANIGVQGGKDGVAEFLLKTLRDETPMRIEAGGGRIYRAFLSGQERQIRIVVSDKGYIVTAYPF